MNLAKLENLLHASLAFSFAAGMLLVAAPSAKADAADDWVAYRVAHGLPVTAKPSLPSERPSDEGPVPEARLASLPAVVSAKGDGNGNGHGHGNGNGNGNGGRYCDPFLIEMARTDGDVQGETARCK